MVRTRYSFSSRRTRRIENIRKQKIEYPKVVEKLINQSDIILQILDARFIEETRNVDIEDDIKSQGKKLIYVLNKIDLIEKSKINQKVLSKLQPHILISSTTRRGSKGLRDRIKIESKKIDNPINSSGTISVGVIGYPNTGKSTLINILIGRKRAGTGSEAGYTKGIQKLKLSEGIHLIDSPGVIPKRQYSSVEKIKIAQQTKVGGRSFSQVKDPDLVVADIIRSYRGTLEKYYKINSKGNSEILIEELGKRKGFLKKGGVIDDDKTARLIIRDWQEGKIKIK